MVSPTKNQRTINELGTKLNVEVLSRKVSAIVVKKPFYDSKKKIANS